MEKNLKNGGIKGSDSDLTIIVDTGECNERRNTDSIIPDS
jgi:hypothetical protein